MANPTSSVTWSAFPNADSYDVEILDAANTVVATGNTAGLSIPLAGLMAGLADGPDYKARVRAVVGAYKTDWSLVIFSWTSTYPGTVENVTVS